MRHDLYVADVVDGDDVNFVVVMVADGFVNLPTDPSKPIVPTVIVIEYLLIKNHRAVLLHVIAGSC
jgi:hypothetical protein